MEISGNIEQILPVGNDLFHSTGLGVGSDHGFCDTHPRPPEWFPCVDGICLPSLCGIGLNRDIGGVETIVELTTEGVTLDPNGKTTIFLIKPEGVLANLNDSLHLLTGPDAHVVGLYKLELPENFLHWLYPQWVGEDGSYHESLKAHMKAGPSLVGFASGESALQTVRLNQGRWGVSSGLRGVFRGRTDGNEFFWEEWKRMMGAGFNPLGLSRGFYNGVHSAHDNAEYIRMVAGIHATEMLGAQVSKYIEPIAQMVYRRPDTYLHRVGGGEL